MLRWFRANFSPKPDPQPSGKMKTSRKYEQIISDLKLSHAQQHQIVIQWLGFVLLMEALTKRHFVLYNIFNITSIVCGILVPAAINFDPQGTNHLALVLGILAGISAAINQSYKCNDRWKHFREICERTRIEGESFFSLSLGYEQYNDHNQAFRSFMRNVSLIKQGQITQYIKEIDPKDKNGSLKEEKEKETSEDSGKLT
jgi:hypothetical protein